MIRTKFLATTLLTLAMPHGASADDVHPLSGYTARIALSCAGERLADVLAAPDADGRFVYSTHDRIPYVRAISVDDAGRHTKTVGNDLVTGTEVSFSARRVGEELELDVDATVSTLVKMDRFTLDDRTIDLPDVNRCAYKGKAIARPFGDGWKITGLAGADSMVIDVAITPGRL